MYFTVVPGQDEGAYRRILGNFAELARDSVKFLCGAWQIAQAPSFAERTRYPSTVLLLTRHVCEQLDGVSS
jgi:hypothetical protein